MDIIRVLQRVIDHANSRDPGEEKEMDALELSDSEADDVDFTMRRMEEILVKPVLKRTLAAGSTSKTREIDKATELSDELSETVPYNLSLLRKMLAEMRQTREMIGSPSSLSPSESQSTSQIIDPSPTPNSIQRTLESLTSLTALTRLRKEHSVLTELALGGERGLRRVQVREWVQKWAGGIVEAIESDMREAKGFDAIKNLRKTKKRVGEKALDTASVTEEGRNVGMSLRGESTHEGNELEADADGLPTSAGKQWLKEEALTWTAGMPEGKRVASSRLPPISPFLALLPNSTIAHITVGQMLRMYGSGGVQEGTKTARAVISLGRAIEEEVILRKTVEKERKERKMRMKMKTSLKSFSEAGNSAGGLAQPAPSDVAATEVDEGGPVLSTGEMPEWTQTVRAKIGSYLIDKLLQVATVDVENGDLIETHPAFFHSYDYQAGRKIGIIRVHPKVAAQMSKEPPRDQLYARHLPMLVQPKPWVGEDEGGYLFSKNTVMRYKESLEQQVYTREAATAGHLELVFASLDVLGSTPWKINRFVFDTMLEVWNSGSELAKVPPEQLDLVDPPPPDVDSADPEVRSKYIQQVQNNAVSRANNHSERCNVNYKLEIAKAFLNDTIYFPHNVDFRGRAYPIPPHLNHIGDDLSRGLLLFAEARELSAEGLRWLKIHLAGLFGFDKASFKEREEWVQEHLEDIRDCAEKPLTGRRWWSQADDPWQFLAACRELINALDSPDPLAYKSPLPIHQDGTCNGLQHYAALGGDLDGAKQVNLVSGDKPSDVYTHVAQLVEKTIEADIEKGVEIAKLVQGKISRKVVKQTVMTTVYGVTFVGARDQIARQLKDKRVIPLDRCWEASAYIAKNVLAAIGNLFSGAKGIMNWFSVCARLISKGIPSDRFDLLRETAGSVTAWSKGIVSEQMSTVIWTTPLGLPVVQPYRRTKRHQLKTAMQTVYISDPNEPAEVDSVKQASAFPPNFIHSLDATHMMLTALECRANGITFASVHDSYWTHASTIGKMSEIIRDTFVSLHSSDVLTRLRDEFNTRYKDFKVPVTSLRSPTLYRKIRSAGTRKKRTPSASKQDSVLAEIDTDKVDSATLSDDEPAGDEEPRGDKNHMGIDNTRRSYASIAPDPCIADPPDLAMYGYFYLTDLLPPLPKKGTFNVEKIKQSEYFFS